MILRVLLPLVMVSWHHLSTAFLISRGRGLSTKTHVTRDKSSSCLHAAASNGRFVVLTREAGKNDKLRARLEKQEIDVLELPCITHCHGEDHGRLSDVLDKENFDYVVITSPESAHVFLEVVKSSCATYRPNNIVSIGEATAALLKKEGASIIYTPSKSLAKVLAVELPAVARDKKKTRVLYPASKKAQSTLEDGLTSRGFEVMRLNTYDTVPAEWSEEEQDKARSCDVVTFASPSALKVWISRLGMNYKVACIGETTAEAAKQAGWQPEQVYWPEAPGLDGWMESVMKALNIQVKC